MSDDRPLWLYLLQENERRAKLKVRVHLSLLACAGIVAGSLLYIAVFK